MVLPLKQTMTAAMAKSELERVETDLRKARGHKKLGQLTQAEDGMMSLQSADYSKFDVDRTMLGTSASAPDLSAARRKSTTLSQDANSPARRTSFTMRAGTPQP